MVVDGGGIAGRHAQRCVDRRRRGAIPDDRKRVAVIADIALPYDHSMVVDARGFAGSSAGGPARKGRADAR